MSKLVSVDVVVVVGLPLIHEKEVVCVFFPFLRCPHKVAIFFTHKYIFEKKKNVHI